MRVEEDGEEQVEQEEEEKEEEEEEEECNRAQFSGGTAGR